MATAEVLAKYKQLLVNLLPKGRLWSPQDQPNLSALLEALATELCRIDGRSNDLLSEADPRITDELLDDWERLLGLPDECTPAGLTDDERRNQILQKYTNIGGLSKTFYEFIGAQLGVTVTVTDYKQALAGSSVGNLPPRGARAGDPLSNFWFEVCVAGTGQGQTPPTGCRAGDQLRFWGWRFYFRVDIPSATPAAQIELIECTMKKLKPAHSAIFFTFS